MPSICRAAGRHGPGALDQVGAQVIHLEAGHFVDKVAAAFPGVQLVHQVRIEWGILPCYQGVTEQVASPKNLCKLFAWPLYLCA